MKKLINQLHIFLNAQEFDHFFDSLRKRLATDSMLFNLITQLEARYIDFKKMCIANLISKEEESNTRSEFAKDLKDLLSLLETEDIREEDISFSIENLCNHIKEKDKIFGDLAGQQGRSLIRLGENLYKLGSFLQNDESKNGDIPYEEYLKIGAKKVYRQTVIGLKEYEAFKKSIGSPFQDIISAYSKLVLYLDHPKERIGTQGIELIQKAWERVAKLIELIEKDGDTIPLKFQETAEGFDNIQRLRPQADERLNVVFDTFEKVKIELLKMVDLSKTIDLALQKRNSQLKEIHVELKMSLETLK